MSTTEEPTTDLAQNPISDLNTGFLRDMLVTIRTFDERPSGQMVMGRMEEIAGYDDLNHGRVYPALDELVEKGYVEKGELDRRTNYYAITSRGEQALEDYSEFVGDNDE